MPVNPGSQQFVWALPDEAELNNDQGDIYSDIFRLVDSSAWQLCLRPCSCWPNTFDEEPPKSVRCRPSQDESENWMGLWVQHREDIDHKTLQVFYSLVLVDSQGTELAGHSDMWLSTFKNQLRGSYWFACRRGFEDALASGPLNVIFTVSFQSAAGDLCPIKSPLSHSAQRDVTLQIKGFTLPIHSTAIPSQSMRAQANVSFGLKGGLRRRRRKVIDLSEYITSRKALQLFVETIYTPSVALLREAEITDLCQILTASRKFDLRLQTAIIERALLSSPKLQNPSGLNSAASSLSSNREFQVQFWGYIANTAL